MEVLTTPAHITRPIPFSRQEMAGEIAVVRDQVAPAGRERVNAARIDEQSSHKATARRQFLEQQRTGPLSVTIHNVTPQPFQRRNLPGLPQLDHGVASSAFLAQQISQIELLEEAQNAVHEAAANAYESTLRRSAVVLGFQGGSGFYA